MGDRSVAEYKPVFDVDDDDVAYVTETRHFLHGIPELGFHEFKTCAKIVDELRKLDGCFVFPNLGVEPGNTGVLAYLPATSPSSPADAIGFRADIDGLAISERTGAPWTSVHDGRMHACGHDAHTAIALAACRKYSKMKRNNHLVFIWQPAEEGNAGALTMTDLINGSYWRHCSSAVKRYATLADAQADVSFNGDVVVVPKMGQLYALHGSGVCYKGSLLTRPGVVTSSSSRFYITIRGAPGHAALPHLSNDPIVAGAHIVTAVQSITSRNCDPQDSVVLTVASFMAGTGAHNIIPDHAKLIGTIRCLSTETMDMVKTRLSSLCNTMSSSFGCRAEIEYVEGYPCVNNDSGVALHALKAAERDIGQYVSIKWLYGVSMASEDFAFYNKYTRCCYWVVGLRQPGGGEINLHSNMFDFPDDCLANGIRLWLCLGQQTDEIDHTADYSWKHAIDVPNSMDEYVQQLKLQ